MEKKARERNKLKGSGRLDGRETNRMRKEKKISVKIPPHLSPCSLVQFLHLVYLLANQSRRLISVLR